MQIQLIRHATLLVQFGGRRLLIDPMLSPAKAMDPIPNSASARRIPMVELPLDDAALADLLATLDGVLVTHLHRDHWDDRAQALIPKTVPVLCQPGDEETFRAAGFVTVLPVEDTITWAGIDIQRTGGQHGTGELGRLMGPVSGFVLRAPEEATLYIAGDTIWCADVAKALTGHAPDVAVLNAGAAQFLQGDPITMTTADVISVCQAAPQTDVVAVHLETINHCGLTRAQLASGVAAAGLSERLTIPRDGDTLTR